MAAEYPKAQHRADFRVIRELRRRMGLSQEQVALGAQIHKNTYGPMESEEEFEKKRTFKEYNLEAVARVLEVALPDIVYGFPIGRISASLREVLDQLWQRHRDANRAVTTAHLLYELIGLDNSCLFAAIDRHACAESFSRRLGTALERISGQIGGFTGQTYEEDRYVQRGREYGMQADRDAYEADVSRAIMQIALLTPEQDRSETAKWVVGELGADVIAAVVGHLAEWNPPDDSETPPMPDITRTAP